MTASGAMPDDLRQVVAEVEAEARAKRESGDYPAELERELDALFRDLSPERLNEHDFEAVLERAERASLIDIHAPIEDQRAVAAKAKAAVQKLILWYMDYVVAQLSTFAGGTTRAVRLLGERVEALAVQVAELEHRLPSEAMPAAATGVPSGRSPAGAWSDELVDMLRDMLPGGPGRVAHVDAGDGSLVRRLREAGVDAYGVDPNVRSESLELRTGDAVGHLHTVGEGALAAVVLSGSVDTLARPAKLALLQRASEVVAPGGCVAVVGTHPDAWESLSSPVARDLAAGRPFHPETWQVLLDGHGMEGVSVREREGVFLVVGTRPV